VIGAGRPAKDGALAAFVASMPVRPVSVEQLEIEELRCPSRYGLRRQSEGGCDRFRQQWRFSIMIAMVEMARSRHVVANTPHRCVCDHSSEGRVLGHAAGADSGFPPL
jgi:hypothetical protein